MLDVQTLSWFVVAALLLIVTPGPAVLYIVARSVDQGRPAGFVSALAIGLGTLVHVAAASLGLSAVLLSSALAFSVVKYLGAAYLIVLGLRTLASRVPSEGLSRGQPRALRRTFVDGVVVAVLNPKTALFFLAFLPQFADVARGGVAFQIFMLGMIFTALALVCDSALVVAAAATRRWMRGHSAAVQRQRYVTGGVYVALGLGTALADAGE